MEPSFAGHFDFALPALVNFVGGGGKTSLILRLSQELSEAHVPLYTTTTRIHPPDPDDGLVVLCGNDARCLQFVLDWLGRNPDPHLRRLVVTDIERHPDLLHGVPPDFAASIDRSLFPVILNEADGARSMSLKMPREGEPVLMEGSDYLVPVIGLDCLNKPLGPETLFRWELARERHSLQAGETITPDLAASLLLHPAGVCRDWRPGIRIIPYINKADSAVQDPLVQELGQAILHNGNFPIERIVWGSLHFDRVGAIPPRVH